MKKGTISRTIVLAVVFLSSCTTHAIKKKPIDNEVWITIFVHGTISAILRRPNINTLLRLMQDSVEDSQYKRATAHIRNHEYYLKQQAVQGLGLHKIAKKDTGPGKAATAFAQIFDKQDLWLNGRKKQLNYYYTFGWSGLISRKERYEEAKQFYTQLLQKIEPFKKQGINPKIRIVGYSHGGSMGLCLALVQKREQLEQIDIDELILIGMPIHKKTIQAVNHPMFKKVVNIYSKGDSVQTLDFTLPGIFSRKFLTPTKRKPLPEKLVQIQIKTVKNRTTKKQWNKKNDPRRNTKDPIFLNGNAQLLRKMRPTHCELWFFDWTRISYRKQFPLSPLPVAALLPAILKETKHHDCCKDNHLVIELRPQHETMIVNPGTGRLAKPLFSEKKLKVLKKIARSFAVKRQPDKEYRAMVKAAIKKAVQEIKKEREKQVSRADLIPQLEKIFHKQLLSTLTEYRIRNNRCIEVCLI